MSRTTIFALESGEVIDDKEVETTIQSYMLGIECALEDIDTANKVKWLIVNSQTETISKEALAIADNVIKGLCRNNKLKSPHNTISIESISLSDQKTFVLESIGSFLKNIWEGICNTFKSMWKWVMSFFFGNKTKIAKQKKDIKGLKEKVEKTTEKCKDNDVSVHSNDFMEDNNVMQKFKYLNSNVTLKDFTDNLKQLEKVAEHLKEFIKSVLHTYESFISVYGHLLSTLPPESTETAIAIAAISKAQEEDKNTALHKFINGLEKMKDNQIVDLSEKVKEDDDSLNVSTAKSIDGFANAGYIGFYTTFKNDNLYHKCRVVRSFNDEKTSKIAYIDLNHLNNFVEEVGKLSDISDSLNQVMTAETIKIQNADEKIKATITKLVEMCKDMDKDAVDAATKNIKDISTNMKNMIQNITTMPTIFRETVDGYIHLLNVNNQYYEKLSKD